MFIKYFEEIIIFFFISWMNSPAFSTDKDEVFSWVGVIMYLPPGQTEQQRKEIQRRFEDYVELMDPLVDKYNANVRQFLEPSSGTCLILC